MEDGRAPPLHFFNAQALTHSPMPRLASVFLMERDASGSIFIMERMQSMFSGTTSLSW